jgi:hypothetical protein
MPKSREPSWARFREWPDVIAFLVGKSDPLREALEGFGRDDWMGLLLALTDVALRLEHEFGQEAVYLGPSTHQVIRGGDGLDLPSMLLRSSVDTTPPAWRVRRRWHVWEVEIVFDHDNDWLVRCENFDLDDRVVEELPEGGYVSFDRDGKLHKHEDAEAIDRRIRGRWRTWIDGTDKERYEIPLTTMYGKRVETVYKDTTVASTYLVTVEGGTTYAVGAEELWTHLAKLPPSLEERVDALFTPSAGITRVELYPTPPTTFDRGWVSATYGSQPLGTYKGHSVQRLERVDDRHAHVHTVVGGKYTVRYSDIVGREDVVRWLQHDSAEDSMLTYHARMAETRRLEAMEIARRDHEMKRKQRRKK